MCVCTHLSVWCFFLWVFFSPPPPGLQREDGVFYQTKVQHTSSTRRWCLRARLCITHEVNVKVLELMKYKADEVQSCRRLTWFSLAGGWWGCRVELGRSGDGRADTGWWFPLWGRWSRQEMLLFAPLSYSCCLCLKINRNAGGREQEFG